jgi:PAS domain S-box-containing protein
MLEQWYWIPLGALAILVLYQQLRLYRIDQAARRREELFQIVTENAADMIALVDVKGRRLYNSPAYKRILGYSAAELGETSAFEQIHPDDRFKVLEAAREARETGIGKRMEYRIRHKDGSWRVLESVASAVRDANGEVVKLVIVNRDITERKRAEEQLEHNLFHDPLTGLPNRRLFLDRLHHFSCGRGAIRATSMRCCSPMSTTSRFSTSAWARRRVIRYCSKLRDGWGPVCGKTIRSRAERAARQSRRCRGWAAMSLPFFWMRSPIPATLCGSRPGFSLRWPSPFLSKVRRFGFHAASASR